MILQYCIYIEYRSKYNIRYSENTLNKISRILIQMKSHKGLKIVKYDKQWNPPLSTVQRATRYCQLNSLSPIQNIVQNAATAINPYELIYITAQSIKLTKCSTHRKTIENVDAPTHAHEFWNVAHMFGSRPKGSSV